MEPSLAYLREKFIERTDVTHLSLGNVDGGVVSDPQKFIDIIRKTEKLGFNTFCTWAHRACSEVLQDSTIPNIAAVIAFPTGDVSTADKLGDIARIAMTSRVNRFDIVTNLTFDSNGLVGELGILINELKRYDADKYEFRFIIETPIWSHGLLGNMIRTINLDGNFNKSNMLIKTCTGMRGGIDPQVVDIIRNTASDIKIKASGGIRDLDMVGLLIAGYDVERLGIGHGSAFNILESIDAKLNDNE